MDVVKRSYAAFRRGDIEGWLETLDSDIEWQAASEDPDATPALVAPEAEYLNLV